MSPAWYWKIALEIPTSLTSVLFVFGVVGALIRMSTSRVRLFYWWLGAMVLFIVIVGYGNRHPWYQLPLVPIFAVFAGIMCARAMTLPVFADPRSYAALFMRAGFSITLIAFVAFGSAYVKWFYEPTAAPMRDAGLVLKRTTEPKALIAAADIGDPTIFYYAERKGWHVLEADGIYNGEPIDGAEVIADLEALRKRGANYFVFTFNTAWWLDYYQELRLYAASNGQLMETTPEFKIYRFNPMSK